MKKLTRIKDGKAELLQGATVADAVGKLARLEEFDAFGNLYILPKIGDTIYTVKGGRIKTATAAYIVLSEKNAFIYDYRLLPHRLGVDCFLTKHDAKKATKSLNATSNK